MKKVVLINPPQLNSLDDRLDPPLGLMYLASSLEQAGNNVEICDLASKNENSWNNELKEADVYGFTLFSASFNTSRKISKILRQKNKDSIIIAGGPHATALPEQTLASRDFDFVLRGEGEYSMLEFLKNLDSGKTNSKIISGQPILDLDKLPFPARHLVDLSSYTREVEGEKATSLITSRGCPNSCSFCCKDIHGTKVRFRSIENVMGEVKQLVDNYNIKSFLFYDDIFTLNRKRLYPLCDQLKELDISFRCNGRAGTNTFEDYKKLYESGCKEIAFGIESGSQEILNRVNKRTTIQKNFDAIQNAKRANLLTKAYLMVGFPGETQETINETKKFMDQANPDKFTVFMFVPLPGCDVWKNPKKYGISEISGDWDQFFNIAGQYEGGIAFKTPTLDTNEIRRLHDDLVGYLIHRNGERSYGQRGKIQDYYKKVNI